MRNFENLEMKARQISRSLSFGQYDTAEKAHGQIIAELRKVDMAALAMPELAILQRIGLYLQNTWAEYNLKQKRSFVEGCKDLSNKTSMSGKDIAKIIEGQGVLAL